MRKRTKNSSIFDDVIRTAQERHGKLLIPVVNETFDEHYPKGTQVTRLPDNYQKIVSKTVADSCNVIGDRVYHVECQSRNDSTMVLRMVEYDFMIGLSMAENEDGMYRIRFPRSCVIYLRQNGNTPDKEEMELEFQDGQRITYTVPTVLVQDYTLNEIFDKQLYIFLPFYIMRYEKDMSDISASAERKKALLEEYEDIMDRLEEALKDEPDVYQDILQLMRKVADYQLSRQDNLKEEVGAVMGGKVLPLPSDKLREERAAGRAEGRYQTLVNAVDNAMKNFHVDLEAACKALEITAEEYQLAKETLKKG